MVAFRLPLPSLLLNLIFCRIVLRASPPSRLPLLMAAQPNKGTGEASAGLPLPLGCARYKGMARAIGSLDSEANRGFEVGRYHCGGRHGPAYSAQLPLADRATLPACAPRI